MGIESSKKKEFQKQSAPNALAERGRRVSRVEPASIFHTVKIESNAMLEEKSRILSRRRRSLSELRILSTPGYASIVLLLPSLSLSLSRADICENTAARFVGISSRVSAAKIAMAVS